MVRDQMGHPVDDQDSTKSKPAAAVDLPGTAEGTMASSGPCGAVAAVVATSWTHHSPWQDSWPGDGAGAVAK